MELKEKVIEQGTASKVKRPVISLVMPYFNPGGNLRSTVEEALSVLSSIGIPFEIIAVCDGSTDGSESALDGVADERLKLIKRSKNQGKGFAIREGFSVGKGEFVGFMDADGDIDPKVIPKYIELIEANSSDVVLGSKCHPDSAVEYPVLRRLYSYLYQRLIQILFHLDVKDTQVGIKFIRKSLFDQIEPLMCQERFVFDLELLVALKSLNDSIIITEAPVWIRRRFSSTIDIRAVVTIVFDTLSLYGRFKLGKYRI